MTTLLDLIIAYLIAIWRIRHTPGVPRNVRLNLSRKPNRKKGANMNDAILSWNASTSGNPTSYRVMWIYNSTAQLVQLVPRTSAQDASGYSLDFATSNPAVTVSPGDVIGASMDAFDGVNNLASATVSVPSVTVLGVTVPAVPPPPLAPSVPQNVQLVLA